MRTVIFLSLLLLLPAAAFFYQYCANDQAILDELDVTLISSGNTKAISPAKIYQNRCEPCHGDHAQNHALSKSSIIQGWSAHAIKEALLAYRKGARDAKGMGEMMHGQAASLSDEEIEMLARYITTLK